MPHIKHSGLWVCVVLYLVASLSFSGLKSVGAASPAMPRTSNTREVSPNLGTRGTKAGFVTDQAQVDLIEFNHFIDKVGREVFRQTVFYDWSKADRRFHVRAWRLVRNDDQVPRQQWDPSRYVCTWQDKHIRRQVSAPQMRETWTQQDPERVNREFLSEDQRQPLFESRPKK